MHACVWRITDQQRQHCEVHGCRSGHKAPWAQGALGALGSQSLHTRCVHFAAAVGSTKVSVRANKLSHRWRAVEVLAGATKWSGAQAPRLHGRPCLPGRNRLPRGEVALVYGGAHTLPSLFLLLSKSLLIPKAECRP